MTDDKESAKIALYHERIANTFQLSVAVIVPAAGIICGFFAAIRVFDHNFYSNDLNFILLSIAYVVASVLSLYARWRNRLTKFTNASLLAIFTIITMLFTALVTGYTNAFMVAWAPLMVSADLYFGRAGFALSFLALVVSGALTTQIHPDFVTPLNLIILSQVTLALGIMGLTIAGIRRIAENEGKQLVAVSEQEDLQRERLLALINSMGDAVVTTDEAGEIKVYNSALLSLLDTNVNLIGQKIDTVLKLNDRKKKPVSILADARAIRKLFSRTDLTHTFSDGETIKLYINVAPIKPSYQSHGERGFIFILRDITKEKTLEEERDEFISVVSHELRTPVAIVEGTLSNLRLLREKGGNEQAVIKAINDAHEQTLYLAKMINDLSTLSRAERGIAMEAEDIDLKALLNEMYQNYQTQAKQKGLQLDLDAGAARGVVHTSRLYLEEILQNLVTNALKYTHEGSVTIGVRQNGGLNVFVKDTGIGISKSDQPHMFEKFYRSEDYRTRESSGTGLGLYISKKLADKLGYQLTFESRLNHGSTFTLHINQGTPTESNNKK